MVGQLQKKNDKLSTVNPDKRQNVILSRRTRTYYVVRLSRHIRVRPLIPSTLHSTQTFLLFTLASTLVDLAARAAA